MRLTLKHYLTAALIVAIAGGYYVAKGKMVESPKPGHSQAQTVKTVLAQKKSIPINLNTNGYVIAINTVDVRPQIQNIVHTVHVTEGQDVRAGQLLFTLDARNDSSNLDKAKAQLARDRADLTDAEMNLKRNQELLAKNFVSAAVVDSTRNKLEAARNTVRADQAAIDASSVALGFNQITVSIAGRIGAISVHPGSLAQPSGAPMLTILTMFSSAMYTIDVAINVSTSGGNHPASGPMLYADAMSVIECAIVKAVTTTSS